MESFQQQALFFSMPTDDFDPNRVPEDGEQYLQSVVYERNKCPAVVKKTLKKKTTAKATQATETKTSRFIWEQYNKVSLLNEKNFPELNVQLFIEERIKTKRHRHLTAFVFQ